MAVTGFLFVVGAIAINGRQNRAEFQTSINSTTQQIQQIINETASGYFPSNNTFNCAAGVTGPPVITAGTGNGQGTNLGCVFLGKVVQFVAGPDPEPILTWPIAGNQNGATVDTAYPQPINQIIDNSTLTYGLTTQAMYYNNLPASKTAAFGVLAGDVSGNIFSAAANGIGLQSGSQQMSLYAIKNTTTAYTQATMLGKLQSTIAGPNAPANVYVPVSSVEICFVSGSTNQSGLVTIGNSTAGSTSRQLTVTLQIKGNQTCS